MVFGRKKVYFNLLDEKEIVFRTPGRNLISFQVQLRNISIEIEFVQNVFGLIFDKTHVISDARFKFSDPNEFPIILLFE